MRINRSLAALMFVALVAGAGSAAQDKPALDFKRSRVDALNTSGTPQLVEFYHPT